MMTNRFTLLPFLNVKWYEFQFKTT